MVELSKLCLVSLLFGFIVHVYAEIDSTCGVGEQCTSKVINKYFWPHMHGNPDYYGNPPWPGPTDLQASFKWRWNGPSGVLYEETFVAAVIDDKKNIYVEGDYNMYKLSPDGQLLWTYKTPGQAAGDSPTIMDGMVFGDTLDGKVYALDMETGMAKWVVKTSESNGDEYGGLAAHNGIVVTQGDPKIMIKPWEEIGRGTVRGLNATNGNILWAYESDDVLWDWFPQFPDDDSLIFMETTGLLVRLGLHDGKLIWKNSGIKDTWIDGCQFVARNGLVYSVSMDAPPCRLNIGGVEECPGLVQAHKISDGSLVWKQTVLKPPTSAPVVGRLGKDEHLSLVMPIGQETAECWPEAFALWTWFPSLFLLPDFLQQTIFYVFHQASNILGIEYAWIIWGAATSTHDVMVFDAEDGKHEWTWVGPTSHFMMAPGDREGYLSRSSLGLRNVSCSTSWSAPRIGSDGTIYVGNQNGNFYAIRDVNEDKKIDDEKEVSVYHTKGAFSHEGSAHAPGMIVAVNFDSVFVFKS